MTILFYPALFVVETEVGPGSIDAGLIFGAIGFFAAGLFTLSFPTFISGLVPLAILIFATGGIFYRYT